MSVEIVKVQIALAGTRMDPGRALVYAEGRDRMAEQPVTDATRKALDGAPKGFFEATWSSKGLWELGKRVADRDW